MLSPKANAEPEEWKIRSFHRLLNRHSAVAREAYRRNRAVSQDVIYIGIWPPFSIGIGFPPLSWHSFSDEAMVRPWPLHEFWPGPGLLAPLQALLPLQSLFPAHFTFAC